MTNIYREKITALRQEIVNDITKTLIDNGVDSLVIRGAIPFSPNGGTIKEYHLRQIELIDGDAFVSGDWTKPVKKLPLIDLHAGILDFYGLVKVADAVDSALKVKRSSLGDD